MVLEISYFLMASLFVLLGGLAPTDDEYACSAGDIIACERVIDLKGSELAIYLVRKGNLHFGRENYEAAITEFSRAIDINPRSYIAYMARGMVYSDLNMHKLAISDFTIAISVYPFEEKPAKLYVDRGRSYALSGKDNLALKDYETAIGINPDDGVVYKQRAYIYLRQNRFAEAEADMRKALGYLPGDPEIQSSLGDVFYYAGKAEEAKRQWQETCKWAGEGITRDWQRRLSLIDRYDGPMDCRCDEDLIELFAQCARDRCQF